MFKEVSDSSLIIDKSGIHNIDPSYKKGHLDEAITNRNRVTKQKWPVYHNQSYRKPRNIANQSQYCRVRGRKSKYLIQHYNFDNKYSFNSSYFYIFQEQ